MTGLNSFGKEMSGGGYEPKLPIIATSSSIDG